MQELNIPYYSKNTNSVDSFSENADGHCTHPIKHNPWNTQFSGKVDFKISYTDDGILLKYNVVEENVLTRFTNANDPVYKDSCVEFFMGIKGESSYYNFEFNSTGTCLAGYGTSAENRKLISPEAINMIAVRSGFKSIVFDEKDMINWELTLLIPNEAFEFHKIDSFSGEEVRVNFYKCGDDLPSPHYLCWNPIVDTPDPDFHLPAHFGKAIFLKN